MQINHNSKTQKIMNYEITHNKDTHRFETIVEGCIGYVEYHPYQGTIDIVHTIVPAKIEGRGVAAALVKAVYEYARENDLKVIPSCSYAMIWSKRHPEYNETTV